MHRANGATWAHSPRFRLPNSTNVKCSISSVIEVAPASGMRMLTYFINRAGKGLSAARKRNLEKAKELLSERVHKAHDREKKNKTQ